MLRSAFHQTGVVIRPVTLPNRSPHQTDVLARPIVKSDPLTFSSPPTHTDRKSRDRIPEQGQIAISEIEPRISNPHDHRNRFILLPVSTCCLPVIEHIPPRSASNRLFSLRSSYLINKDVCYLVLTEKNFSKRLAFNYLEDIQNEFIKQYGQKINSANRPYNFIEFGELIDLSSC